MLVRESIQECAVNLYQALLKRLTITKLSDKFPDMTIDEAYHIQEKVVQLRVAEGEEITGYKIGLTNKQKMADANVSEPIRGYLLTSMVLAEGSVLPIVELIQPKVEVEIAFVLKSDLQGPGITAEDVMNATDYIVPALEIVDSRYHDFKFAFADGVADNICAGRLVIGRHHTKAGSVDNIDVALYINGKPIASGNSSNVLDNPANAVASLANMLARDNKKLKAGNIITSGAITDAVSFSQGDIVSAEFTNLGTVSMNVI